MAEAKTPEWAKRLEGKIDQLIAIQGQEEKCYYHAKYGAAAQRKCNPPCRYAIKLMESKERIEPVASLSPIVENILKFMEPMKCISPIRTNEKLRRLEEDIVPIKTQKKKKKN